MLTNYKSDENKEDNGCVNTYLNVFNINMVIKFYRAIPSLIFSLSRS